MQITKFFLTMGLAVVVTAGCSTTGTKTAARDTTIDDLVLSAREFVLRNDYADALKHYQKALELEPDNRDLRLELANFYLDSGRIEPARIIFTGLLETNPVDVDAMEGLGICLLKSANYSEAKSWFTAIAAATPQRPRTLNYLGVLADIDGDYEQATTYYRAALALEPNNALYLNNAAYSKIMQHRYGEAEELLLLALGVQLSMDARVRNNLLLAYAWQGKYEKALEVVSPGHDDPVAYNNVGYIALLREDYVQAIEYFSQALTLSPTYYHRAELNREKAQRLLKAVATAQ